MNISCKVNKNILFNFVKQIYLAQAFWVITNVSKGETLLPHVQPVDFILSFLLAKKSVSSLLTSFLRLVIKILPFFIYRLHDTLARNGLLFCLIFVLWKLKKDLSNGINIVSAPLQTMFFLF